MLSSEDIKTLLVQVLTGDVEAYRKFCQSRLLPEVSWGVADTLAYICEKSDSDRLTRCYPEMLMEIGYSLWSCPKLLLSENGKLTVKLLQEAELEEDTSSKQQGKTPRTT